MPDDAFRTDEAVLPAWVPRDVRDYLDHTGASVPLRRLAEAEGCHASTILRRVRRVEARRDDTLYDHALDRVGGPARRRAPLTQRDEDMTVTLKTRADLPTDDTVDREARRVLRRLSETGACLAVAADMEKAVVVRETSDGQSVRTAVLDRPVAEAMALKDWVSCSRRGRISRYTITPAGRAALKRLLAEQDATQDSHAAQHRDMAERTVADGEGGTRRLRYNVQESPVLALSRRKDKDGRPFINPRMVAAAERLREDFELAQIGPRVAQNWDSFLTGGNRGGISAGGPGAGSSAARDRVLAALTELGPGLGDMALRCCCFLEGLEATERRMGWSARSGKIVLRIALQRLCRHYDEAAGGWSPLIG